MDIYDTVKNRDKKEWPNQMTKFYKVYVQKLDIKQQEKDPDSTFLFKNLNVRQRGVKETGEPFRTLHRSSLRYFY
jgi:hypothetical protein